jgi:hypothetical protein
MRHGYSLAWATTVVFIFASLLGVTAPADGRSVSGSQTPGQLIKSTLARLQIGEPITFRNLTMFPLVGDVDGHPSYLTLDEGLVNKKARITEVSQQGSVSDLRFVNSGDKPVLLIDGEELVGSKQNRILNVSILVPAHATTIIPVSCVEQGRWSYRSAQFSAAPRIQYSSGRAEKAEQVSDSLLSVGTRESDQRAIWQNIAEKSLRFEAFSTTGAMSEIYEQKRGSVDRFTEQFSGADRQMGAVFAIDGKVVGVDVFDSPKTLAKLLPKLVRSYALDALDPVSSGTAPTSHEVANRFMSTLLAAEATEFGSVGLGSDVRLTSPKLVGGALVVEDRLVHLGAFPRVSKESKMRHRGGIIERLVEVPTSIPATKKIPVVEDIPGCPSGMIEDMRAGVCIPKD